MTITDLAIVTGLGWGTVKDMVKKRLQKDYGAPRLKDLKHLSIDEIYLGRRRKYYTLVLDLWTAVGSFGWPTAAGATPCASSGGRCGVAGPRSKRWPWT